MKNTNKKGKRITSGSIDELIAEEKVEDIGRISFIFHYDSICDGQFYYTIYDDRGNCVDASNIVRVRKAMSLMGVTRQILKKEGYYMSNAMRCREIKYAGNFPRCNNLISQKETITGLLYKNRNDVS